VTVLKAVDSNGFLITEGGIFKSGEVEWVAGG
jgi:hypothetical protein